MHASVPLRVAEALGARSLRELYAVDQSSVDRLPCPSANTLRRCVATFDDGAFRFSDLAEIADAAGAREMEVTLDLTRYPARSLLRPQLAGFQGAALAVTFRGVSLTPTELAHLLSAAAPTKLRRGTIRFGNGLASCADVADVFLAAAGGQLCVFDPTGVALGGESNEASNGPGSDRPFETSGSARRYSYADGELASRFADQFAPFVAAGLDVENDDGATYLRLPLRTAAHAERHAALSKRVADDPGAARDACAVFAADAHRARFSSRRRSNARASP